MMRRAHSARHVIKRILNPGALNQMTSYDAASTMHEFLSAGKQALNSFLRAEQFTREAGPATTCQPRAVPISGTETLPRV